MAVLVTGGAGFIGSHLVETLAARDERVVVLDSFSDSYAPALKRMNMTEIVARYPDVEVLEGDIRDSATVERAFRDGDIRCVVHLAAVAGVRPSLRDPIGYNDVNVHGTIELLEASRKRRVENFVFASSSSVYGVTSRIPFGEDDPVDCPVSPYAVTKRAGELLCRTYANVYGLSAICLRPFTVFGPRQRPSMAISLFVHSMLAGKPIQMFGDGTSTRDYTYVTDIVDGIVKAMGHRGGFGIYNLGGGRPVTLLDLIAVIEKETGTSAQIERCPVQAGDVPRTWADPERAERALGFVARTSLADGIRMYVAWVKSESGLRRRTLDVRH